MSEGIPYADIVILALIAGFILLRLRNVLGQKTGNDGSQFFQSQKPARREERKDTIIQLHEKALKPKAKEETDTYLTGLTNQQLVQVIRDIKVKDPLFSATQFMDGAKMAFEMVFDAFAKEDTATLKMLLSDSVYREFSREVEARHKQENKTETTLIAVTSREMQHAELTGNMARITVKFTSEQITVLRGAKGELLEGDASETQLVESDWIFERDVTSKNPNWKIIET